MTIRSFNSSVERMAAGAKGSAHSQIWVLARAEVGDLPYVLAGVDQIGAHALREMCGTPELPELSNAA